VLKGPCDVVKGLWRQEAVEKRRGHGGRRPALPGHFSKESTPDTIPRAAGAVINMHIKTLQRKMGTHDLIETVLGIGYRFIDESPNHRREADPRPCLAEALRTRFSARKSASLIILAGVPP